MLAFKTAVTRLLKKYMQNEINKTLSNYELYF